VKTRAFLLLLILGLDARGQSSYGRVTGRITDPSDALAAGAAIPAAQAGTNVVVKTSSNSAGVYELLNLLPGEYRLAVELEGFKRDERGPIAVPVGDVLTVDVQLEVGPASPVVTVTAGAPLIESASASMGQVVQQRPINDLALPGGAATCLMQFSPSVNSLNAPTHGWLPQARDSISNMAVGDHAGRMHGFQLWANLPSSLKMTPPRYQEVKAADIPEIKDDDGAQVRIVCGNFWGTKGPVDGIAANPIYLDVSVPQGRRKTLPVETTRHVFAYVFAGSGKFCNASGPLAVPIEGVG